MMLWLPTLFGFRRPRINDLNYQQRVRVAINE